MLCDIGYESRTQEYAHGCSVVPTHTHFACIKMSAEHVHACMHYDKLTFCQQ